MPDIVDSLAAGGKSPQWAAKGLSVFLMSLRAQRGNLVAVAMMVPRHVLNLNEIATSLRSSQ